jgi:uncharacterized protein
VSLVQIQSPRPIFRLSIGRPLARRRDRNFHLGYDDHPVGRLLSLLLLVVVAVWLVRRALRRIGAHDEAAPPPAQASSPEELVRCAHCSVLLPRGEARMAGGVLYCGEEHARLGPRASRNA